MEESKEIFSLQVLQNQPFDDSVDISSLDPNLCSWNQKRYPELKSQNFSAKLKPINSRVSPKSCPKAVKNTHGEKEVYNISANAIYSQSPGPSSSLRGNFKANNSILYTKNVKTPEPFPMKKFSETPKNMKGSKNLNSITLRKFKLKLLHKMKPLDQASLNLSNPKYLEFFSQIKSPYIQHRKSPIISNKLPLSTAQTLEELLRNTKIHEINKKYLKYKLL
jgi:hypothetical protein